MGLSVRMGRTFSRAVALYWDDDDLSAFEGWISENPDAGAIMPGSGGVRKVRWARRGMGKSGGLRVIYYVKHADECVWLLHAYAKSKQDNISPSVARKLKEAIDG